MEKYEVYGQTIMDVYVTVEADSEEEAMEMVEDMGFGVEEYCDETIGVDCSDSDEFEELRVRASGTIDFTDVEEV